MNMRKHFHESNLIEGYDIPAFDAQQAIAWRFLSKQKYLNKGIICKVQKMVTLKQDDLRPDWRGYYRKIEVRIGFRKAMPSERVQEAMDFWLGYYKNLTPKQAHIEFEKIHPFVDGNGRTGRLLMWWMEVQRGEDPTLILFSNRNEYYRWFE